MRRWLSGVALALVSACGETVTTEHDASVPEPSMPMLVAPTSLIIVEGETTTFAVTLAEPPTSSVTIHVASEDPLTAAVSPSEITLDGTNLTATVTVSAPEDDDDIINEMPVIALGIDEGDHKRVTTRVIDNDVQQLIADTTNLTVTESASQVFGVRLARKPSGVVSVSVWSDAPQVADVSPATLTFDPTFYNVPMFVTVTGIADTNIVNGAAHVYAGQVPNTANARVDVAVTDDDAPALVISANTVTVGEGSTTSFSVALGYDPLGQILVSLQSNDPGAATINELLQFTSSNYSVPQTVTVTGIEDADTTNESVTFTLAGPATASVSAAVTDNDALIVQSANVLEGRTTSFAVRLANDPGPAGLPVTVEVLGGNAVVAPTSFIIASGTQSVAHEFQVTGLIDAAANANRSALIRVSAPGQTARDIPITIYDMIPGDITTSSLLLQNPAIGAVGALDMSFSTENPWPGDGRLVITFPPGFDVSAATIDSSDVSGSLSLTVTTSTVTLQRSNGTETSGPIKLRLLGIRNPTASGNYPITVATQTATGEARDSVTRTLGIYARMLQDAAITFSTLQPGATGNATISFTTQDEWPADGQFYIGFPIGFTVSAATFVSHTGLTGTFTVSVDNYHVLLTRTGGAPLPAGSAVSITLGNITNAGASLATNYFVLNMNDASGAQIGYAYPKGVTIGCPASITKLANDGYNVPFGGNPWTYTIGVTNPYYNGGAYIPILESSDLLVARDFQFFIPAGAAITGIRFERWHDNENWPVVDSAVRAVKGGTVGTADRASTTTWQRWQVVGYGSATDLWGQSWSAADVESSDFGDAMAVRALTPGKTGTVHISRVTATVYLSCP